MQQIAGQDFEDVILIHTCAVTAEAERQCRQAIRQAARQNPDKKIIVAGCAAQRSPEVFAAMPEVWRVLGNHEKLTREALISPKRVLVGPPDGMPPVVPLISSMEGRNRAFLQIQQGCDHTCTFCVVRTLRGRNTGTPPDRVIEQARLFVRNGFSEIVLTGVDVASYPHGLWQLTERLLCEVEGLKRLRFGSLRRHSREDVLAFAERLRAVNPLATLGADLIAGFPTETAEQFEETLDLIERAQITHGHIFPYSAREGTPAAKMTQVSKAVRQERAARARQISERVYQKWLDKMVGKTVSVLVEQNGFGYTDNYIGVRVPQTDSVGQIVVGRIQGKDKNELVF